MQRNNLCIYYVLCVSLVQISKNLLIIFSEIPAVSSILLSYFVFNDGKYQDILPTQIFSNYLHWVTMM